MNEREFATRIKQDLNYGLGQLSPAVTARLAAAREAALGAMAVPTAETERLALAGHPGHGLGHDTPLARKWLPVAFLLLALAGALYWHAEMSAEPYDIDAAILAGELPLRAYLDPEFQQWIERSQRP